jgi:hypothetical protein
MDAASLCGSLGVAQDDDGDLGAGGHAFAEPRRDDDGCAGFPLFDKGACLGLAGHNGNDEQVLELWTGEDILRQASGHISPVEVDEGDVRREGAAGPVEDSPQDDDHHHGDDQQDHECGFVTDTDLQVLDCDVPELHVNPSG